MNEQMNFANLGNDLLKLKSKAACRGEIRIEFDGGTPCNVPAQGYGIGYGSYCISYKGRTIFRKRVSHGEPMSANAAELMTLYCALQECVQMGIDKPTHKLHIIGDSQIALKWASTSCKGNVAKGSSEVFRKAINLVRGEILGYLEVRCEWRARCHSVKQFGH